MATATRQPKEGTPEENTNIPFVFVFNTFDSKRRAASVVFVARALLLQ